MRDLQDKEENEVESKKVHKFLVANKQDAVDEQEVSAQMGTEFAKQINANFHEVSAKENLGVFELF